MLTSGVRVTRWRSTILFTHVQVTSHSLRVSETKSRHLATLSGGRTATYSRKPCSPSFPIPSVPTSRRRRGSPVQGTLNRRRRSYTSSPFLPDPTSRQPGRHTRTGYNGLSLTYCISPPLSFKLRRRKLSFNFCQMMVPSRPGLMVTN